MRMDADVLIVGGGPAGLCAAIALARQGISSIVFEAGTLPQSKVCGQGLMPTGWRILKSLGVADRVPAEHSCALRGVRYVARNGAVAEAAFAEGAGRGMRRETLSAALLARAAECSAVAILKNTRVNSIICNTDSIFLSTVENKTYAGRLLIGADGLRSAVRRWRGLEDSGRRAWRWGARQHFAIAPWSGFVEVYAADGLEVYVTPASAGETELAFLWDATRFHLRGGIAGMREQLLAPFPALRARLQGVASTDLIAAVGPLAQRSRAVIGQRTALIGDASGYIDACTGEGLSLAFEQALALADALASGRRGDDFEADALQAYARSHRRLTRNYRWLTPVVRALIQRRRLWNLSVAVLGRWPTLFRRLLSWNMGAGRKLLVETKAAVAN